VDPVAGAFQNWDDRGNYNPPDAWFGDMREPGFGKQSIKGDTRMESLSWLAQRVTTDRRFDVAIVHLMYQALVGQLPLALPNSDDATDYDIELEAYNVQKDLLTQIAQEFRANDHNLKAVIKAIVRSPYYRAIGAEADANEVQAIQWERLGAGRMLTPEMLNRKIRAITNLPWRPRVDDTDYLLDLDEYKILYGGIDSDDVTERITEPNGIMSNVQLRMANELACLNTARDFGREEGARLFFPYVEMGFVPEDENGFAVNQAVGAIKKNIQHLHWHILGEEVELSGPEVTLVYNLFFDLWEDGKASIEAEEAGTRLANSCQYRSDYWTGRDVPDEEEIIDDPDYTVRAWMGVMAFMFSDYRFLYE